MLTAAFLIITLIISVTLHEYAHAWMADHWGDDTPRLHGRLTLNPFAHLDPLGFLALIVFKIGWAKPVPVNYRYLRYKGNWALISTILAGPLANLLLALLAVILIGLLGLPGASLYAAFLSDFAFYNVFLALFNLLPLYPLDGGRIAQALLCDRLAYSVCATWRQASPFILIFLLFSGGTHFLATLSLAILRVMFAFIV